jgi:hypothetical protein
LLAGGGVLAIVNTRAAKQNETCFHILVLNGEPVRSQRVST